MKEQKKWYKITDKNERNKPQREHLVRILLCILNHSCNIYAFSLNASSLAHLYFYTVHMHNASFTLYMHTLHEYPRCLKLIAILRDCQNIAYDLDNIILFTLRVLKII